MVSAALLFACLYTSAQQKQIRQITNTIEQQRLAWNRGDIEGFMDAYWNNDSLMFIGKSGITYGWKQTIANYKRNYPDTVTMGQLDFKLMQFEKITASCFLITGKWHLKRSIGDVGGYFTLLMRRLGKKWVIVKDHTS
jgi:hypothetical protein